MSRSGLLIMGFGGPGSVEDCGPFMRDLMGQEPPEELVERVERRYLAIGGRSPLLEIAQGIAVSLGDGLGVPVAVGMRYWHPYIGEALASLAAGGVDRVVALSLSPFESKVATGAYRRAVEEALAEVESVEVVEAPHVGETPGFRSFLSAACDQALDDVAERGARRPFVIFTAHSLPLEDLVDDDPYVGALRRCAAETALGSGMAAGRDLSAGESSIGIGGFGSAEGERPWMLCYQSRGNRAGEWLEPTAEDVADAAVAGGFDAVVACPIGFLTDHMETLYDLDVELADRVLSSGAEFARADAPNGSDVMIATLREVVGPLL